MSLRVVITFLALCSSVAFRLHHKRDKVDIGFKANSAGSPQTLEGVCDISPFDERTGRNGEKNCEVQLDVPSACAGSTTKCGLVFAFHGSGGSNKGWARQMGMKLHGGGYKMIGVYPNGAAKDSGQPGWNTGGASSVDDKAFVLHIVSVLKARGWQGRRYSYGNSNGGAMSTEIATNGIMGFSGIGSVVTQLLGDPDRAGPGPYNWLHPVEGEGEKGSCTVPIAVITVGGTNDRMIPYNGGYSRAAGGTFMTFEESNEVWAKINKCDERFDTLEVKAKSGRSDLVAEKMTWHCPSTTPQVHYKVIDGEHVGMRSLEGKDIPEVVLDFFAKVDQELDAGGKPAEPDLSDSCRRILA